MGIGLAGSSDAYPPMDDQQILGQVRVIASDGAYVFADDVVPGDRNTLVGRNVVAETSSADNTVLGRNITVAAGVRNAISIGRNNRTLTESNSVTVGTALEYNTVSGRFEAAGGLINGNVRTGDVQLGSDGANGGAVSVSTADGAQIVAPMTVRTRGPATYASGWTFDLETSENDPGARDLIMRATDGSQVIFCAGAAQAVAAP